MTISLDDNARRFIEDRIRGGDYATPEDVVAAAFAALERDELYGDFEAGELDRLLAEGERSGDLLDGEEVLRELRALRSARLPEEAM